MANLRRVRWISGKKEGTCELTQLLQLDSEKHGRRIEKVLRKHRVLAVTVLVKAVSIYNRHSRNLTPTVFLSRTPCRISLRK